MDILVIGCGYVGVSNAISLAYHRNVTVYDIDKNKIDLLSKGISPISDKTIITRLKEVKLIATTSKESFKNKDLVLVSVPTNYIKDTNKLDTSIVEEVVSDILKVNKKAKIIIKSTVGVKFSDTLINKLNYKDIYFVPEFLREGNTINDLEYPDRIVVGRYSSSEEEGAKEILNILLEVAKNNPETIITGNSEAEAIKLFSNAYLALRISYFNELDTFAKESKLNVKDIVDGVSLDKRIGNFYNNPSFGYGGYCLPKDTKELESLYNNLPQDIISAIIKSNKTRKEFIVKDIIKNLKQGGTVGVYRLVMKKDSDNFRESSIIDIINLLKQKNINLIIYEPLLKESNFEGIKIYNDLAKFKKDSDIIVANRIDDKIKDKKEKVYSRDLYQID